MDPPQNSGLKFGLMTTGSAMFLKDYSSVLLAMRGSGSAMSDNGASSGEEFRGNKRNS
ncbi:hypothetical protein Ancab_022088, partial [Ancistrocladus abbreviatus]